MAMGKFVIRTTKTGVKFDLKAANSEVILTSEVYKSLKSCKNGIASVVANAPVAAVEDQTAEGFQKEKNSRSTMTRQVKSVSASRQKTDRSSVSAKDTSP